MVAAGVVAAGVVAAVVATGAAVVATGAAVVATGVVAKKFVHIVVKTSEGIYLRLYTELLKLIA